MSKRLSPEEKKKLYQEVVPIATEYRNSFIAETLPIKDTFATLEQLGFLLLRFPALKGNCELAGFTIYKTPYSCIYINSRQNLGRQYLSCWHEVFHAITGEGNGLSYLSASQVDPIEYKADAFAGIILMPENLIKNYMHTRGFLPQNIDKTQIIEMQNYFRVSYSAMLTRLLQIYPESEKELKRHYSLCRNTETARAEMITKTNEAKGDLKLIQPTNDVYLPSTLFDNIEFNVKEKRISKEKAYDLLMLIDSLEDEY